MTDTSTIHHALFPTAIGTCGVAWSAGGLVALYDGRGRNETPVWLPEQRAVVFADGMTAPGGELSVYSTAASAGYERSSSSVSIASRLR